MDLHSFKLSAEGTPLRKTMLSAAVVGAVVVVTAGILAVTNAQAQTNPSNTTSANPLGVSVIRFAPGTTRDAMYAAANSANATVVTDLSKINALAVVSNDKQFAAKARGNAAVRAVWSDKLVRTSEPDPAAGDSAGSPQIGNPGTDPIPDPWHDATSFLGETNPEGILQWDDNRMNVPAAWSTTRGDRPSRWRSSTPAWRARTRSCWRTTTGQDSANTIPCNLLTPAVRSARPEGLLVGRHRGPRHLGRQPHRAVTSTASPPTASPPTSQVMGFKALVHDARRRADELDRRRHDPGLRRRRRPHQHVARRLRRRRCVDVEDYMLWVAAMNYCRAKGTAIFASAGNEHVRINRVNMTVGGAASPASVRSTAGNEGIASVIPADTVADSDLRGLLETPAGVPGVDHGLGDQQRDRGRTRRTCRAAVRWPATAIGARGPADVLLQLRLRGSTSPRPAARGSSTSRVRRRPGRHPVRRLGHARCARPPTARSARTRASASLLTFACFKVNGAAFGWLQGTSMSSPNATGVAALALAAHPGAAARTRCWPGSRRPPGRTWST